MNELQYSLVRNLERAYCIIALLMLSGALFPFMMNWKVPTGAGSMDTQLSQGNLRFQIVSLTIYGIALLIILAERHRLPKLLSGNWPMFALVGLALLSSAWSYYPDTSFRRAAALALTTGFAVYLVLRYSPRELIWLIAISLTIATAFSLVIGMVNPLFGIHHYDVLHGSWRGAFQHKNHAGRIMAIAVPILILLWLDTRGPVRWFVSIGLAMCTLLLALSASRTAWIVTALLVLSLPVLRSLRHSRTPLALRLTIVLMVTIGVIMYVLTHFLVSGLEMLGRDLTLTGRTSVWLFAIEAGMYHPILGAGFRTFWTPEGASYVFARVWGTIGNGHNGYLDVWLELGLVGFVLFMTTLVVAIRRAFRRLTSSRDIIGLFYPMILIYTVVYSVTEKFILEQSDLNWTIYLVALFYLTPQRVVAAMPNPVTARAPFRPAQPMPGNS